MRWEREAEGETEGGKERWGEGDIEREDKIDKKSVW